MAYNVGLAVGLAVGLPCFLILVGVLLLWLRNRRLQRVEDLQANDIDVELRDNNLFTEFLQALHRPYETGARPNVAAADVSDSAEKHISSTDINSLSRGLLLSHTFSDKRRQVTTPTASVINNHQKTPSSYDFYETFIPILPGAQGQEYDLAQPPAISTDLQSTRSSSHASLIGAQNPRDLDRSLDSLAKQLHSPQFFEKLPARGASVGMKQRFTQANNLSSDMVGSVNFDRSAINDNYIYEAADGLPRQKHPYHVRAGPSADLEDSFDKDISTDIQAEEEPAVVFK